MLPLERTWGKSKMTIWLEIQNNLEKDPSLSPGTAVLTALSTAIKCSRNIKFKDGCDCGERFSGRAGGEMEDCYRAEHSLGAIHFIQTSLEEQGWRMWDRDDQMLIDLQVLWTELTGGNVLALLKEGTTGVWAAAMTVVNRANNTPRTQAGLPQHPKVSTAQSSDDNIDISLSTRHSRNLTPRPSNSSGRADYTDINTEIGSTD